MSWCARDLNDDVCIAVNTARDNDAVFSEQTSDDELAGSHGDGAKDEEWATAGGVDVEEDYAGEDDEECAVEELRVSIARVV